MTDTELHSIEIHSTTIHGTDVAADRTDVRARVRARTVTCGVLGLLVLAALLKVEAWPVTSFHLFSGVRSSTSTGMELVAVGPDGARTVVRPDPANPVLVTTGHLYGELADVAPDVQHAMAEGWLDAAGLPADDVVSVRLEKVTRVAEDDGREWRETDRTLVTEVDL